MVILIMTNKLLAQTRVLHAPNISLDKNACQNKPGILKQEGYHTIEYGVTNYMDAYRFIFLDGLDLADGRS